MDKHKMEKGKGWMKWTDGIEINGEGTRKCGIDEFQGNSLFHSPAILFCAKMRAEKG